MKYRQLLLAWLVLLGGGACVPGYVAPPVTAALVKSSTAPVSLIERGYVIHQAKCAKCHAYEDPRDYDEREIKNEIMPVMARKSKLTVTDASAVLAYLLAVRKLPES